MTETVDVKDVMKQKYGAAAERAAQGGGNACCGSSAASPEPWDPITSNLYDQAQAAHVPAAAMLASLGCGNLLREAYRVLKPGGRFAVSDVVVRGEVPESIRRNMELWIGCVAGASRDADYIAKLQAAGFESADIEVTRVYTAEDAQDFPAGQPEQLQQLAREVDGRFVSGFVRARKPLVSANTVEAVNPATATVSASCGCGPRCC